jgi:hypothetical protein
MAGVRATARKRSRPSGNFESGGRSPFRGPEASSTRGGNVARSGWFGEVPASIHAEPETGTAAATALGTAKALNCKGFDLLQKSSGSLRAHQGVQMALQAAMPGRASLLYSYGLSIGLAVACFIYSAGPASMHHSRTDAGPAAARKRVPAVQRSVRVKERCRPHRRQPGGPLGDFDARDAHCRRRSARRNSPHDTLVSGTDGSSIGACTSTIVVSAGEAAPA